MLYRLSIWNSGSYDCGDISLIFFAGEKSEKFSELNLTETENGVY